MPSESERQQAQESRRQALAQQHADDLSGAPDPAREPVSDEYIEALAEADEPQIAQVLVGAQVTEAGIVIEILVPWDSVGFAGPPAVPEDGVGDVPPTDPNAS